MPEPPMPRPTPDRRVSRNLFVEADPDLDALAQSTGDELARGARSRGLVVLAEQHGSPQAARARDAERFTRPNGNVARLRAAVCRAIGQADAAAGRLLRSLAATPYRALVTIVALALVLVAFSWLVFEVRDLSIARAAANGRLARDAVTLSHQQARIGALTAELRQFAQTAGQSQASAGPARAPTAPRYDRHR